MLKQCTVSLTYMKGFQGCIPKLFHLGLTEARGGSWCEDTVGDISLFLIGEINKLRKKDKIERGVVLSADSFWQWFTSSAVYMYFI